MIFLLKLGLFCLIVLIGNLELIAGDSPKNIVASRTHVSPLIDGKLNDEVWNLAVPVTNFLQSDPIEGGEPSERTLVKALFTNNALYFGIICYDSEPKLIRKQLTRRDRSSEADRVSITIDSYNDGKTGFVFAGTVSGVQSDGVVYHDGFFYDYQWDAVWNFAADIFDQGWIAEFEIPFSALRFTVQDRECVWGINFKRYISRKKEIIEWVLIPRNQVGSISKIGNISGIVDITPPVHLTFVPYFVSSGNFINAQRPYTKENALMNSIGIDVKYGITSNFTIDVAINPDFGQVEVDKAEMNLTVFETLFPEKRPFFMEGSNLFLFGLASDEKQLNLFYSRRIGRKPRWSNIEDAEKFYQLPKSTTILGAAKLSGKTESGFTVGALTAATEAENAIYQSNSGIRTKRIVEPAASYNVLRLQQEILGNSSIGLITTGAFVNGITPSIASGVDWNLRFFDNQYALEGYFAGSQYSEKKSLESPINKYYGNAGKLLFGKITADRWSFSTSYDFASKNFNINEMGLYNYPREHGGESRVIYREDQASLLFHRYLIVTQINYRWNFEGVSTFKYLGIGPFFLFKNFWWLNLQFIRNQSAYEEASRGVPIGKYLRPSATQYYLYVVTDTRKAVSASTIALYEFDDKRKKEFITSFNLTFRPLTWLELAPIITFSKRWKEESGLILGGRYITAVDKFSEQYTVFGDRDLQYFDLAFKGIVTLNTKLSVQFFSQVLFYKWNYYDMKLLTRFDKLIDFDIEKHYIHPVYLNYSKLNYKILNANIVLRWEYIRGSTIYLVWTQMRQEYDNQYHTSLIDNIKDTFKTTSDNIVLLKINYWLSL